MKTVLAFLWDAYREATHTKMFQILMIGLVRRFITFRLASTTGAGSSYFIPSQMLL